MREKITALLGDEAKSLLEHTCRAVKKEDLHLLCHDFINHVMIHNAIQDVYLEKILP